MKKPYCDHEKGYWCTCVKFKPHPIQDGPESFDYPPFDKNGPTAEGDPWADPDFVHDEKENRND